MCRLFGVSRSGYYDHVKCLGRPQKDAALAEMLRLQQEHCFQTYGYRRMHLWLESQGIHRNPKTVLRIMKKYSILSEIRRKRKWRNMGQQIHKYENLLNRQFQADCPNTKWATDISYIQTKEGTLYLSMIRDLYDNSIVAYKTAAQQTVNLLLRLRWFESTFPHQKVPAIAGAFSMCCGPRDSAFFRLSPGPLFVFAYS